MSADKRVINPEDVETLVFDWGTLKWTSEPRVSNAQNFSMGIVLLNPGKGHTRHNHPGVEEVLYVVSGEGMQTIDGVNGGEPFPVRPGMTLHIPADVYHSTMNTGWEPLKLIAIYSPHGPEAALREDPAVKIIPAGQSPS